MPSWRKTVWRISHTLRSDKLCLIGASIGFLSMLGFSWIHLYDPLSFPRTSPELAMRLFGDPNWNFGKILAEAMPGAYLFLAGTILACATYLGGFIQALGFTTIFIVRGPSNLGVYANAQFRHWILYCVGLGIRSHGELGGPPKRWTGQCVSQQTRCTISQTGYVGKIAPQESDFSIGRSSSVSDNRQWISVAHPSPSMSRPDV